MTDLLTELRERVDATVRGRSQLAALDDWMTDWTEALAAAADRAVRDLASEVWLWLGEWQARRVSEDEAREHLQAALTRATPTVITITTRQYSPHAGAEVTSANPGGPRPAVRVRAWAAPSPAQAVTAGLSSV